ncbi:MAG: hypothetical protein Q8L48_03605 [Archangium sp.]|nr:hypothetical protein [Archangium sp.]
MKVKASPSPKVSSPRAGKKKKPAQAKATQTSKTWKPGGGATASRKKLSTLATDAAVSVIASHQGPPPKAPLKHPLLARFGEHLGLGLGVIVTEALSLLPKWNKPVVDDQGQPVASIPGAERVGNHDLLARHQEVVGPKVTALVDKMPAGAIHDLLAGFGKGATAAPGTSYRLESAISDMFHKR